MSDLTPGAWFGIALFAAYLVWLWAFFTHVRPSAMRALGRRLRIRVTESAGLLDGGTWSTDDDVPLKKTGGVALADFVLLLLGTVGVAALVFVPAFLVAESGVLLPLESRLTGRAVKLTLRPPDAMDAATGQATLAVEVDKVGRTALRACRAQVAGYSARNGYLHGASPAFDLGVGARVAANVKLESMRPRPGEHRVRIEVECSNERLAVADAVVVVRRR
jgi:hypothetical protein